MSQISRIRNRSFGAAVIFVSLLMSFSDIHIALVGNPNSGKSSLFNALTGLNQKVGNFPGVTVDKKTGSSVLEPGMKVSSLICPAHTVYIPAVRMNGYLIKC